MESGEIGKGDLFVIELGIVCRKMYYNKILYAEKICSIRKKI